MNVPRRFDLARIGAIAALTVALVATCASAYAAPVIGPTLSTAELQQLIDEGPTPGYVEGHLSTVLKGKTITDMSVRVTAVTYGFSDGPPELAALILFEVTDPRVIDPDGIGGIAAGMSGSPIYVDDGGTDKLVGALSYGNWFTKNGFGLATPVDAMKVIENYPAPMGTTSLKSLAEPVVIDGQAVNSIVITDNPDGFEKAAASGTFVAKPLTSQYLGGIDPSVEAVSGVQEARRGQRRQCRAARVRPVRAWSPPTTLSSSRDRPSPFSRPRATFGPVAWARSRT